MKIRQDQVKSSLGGGSLKSDISNLNTGKSNLLVTTSASTSFDVTTSAIKWEIKQTKSGYTPIMYHVYGPHIGTVAMRDENCILSNGSFYCYGYAQRRDGVDNPLAMTARAQILWVKN